jgi:hypothetical protein
VSTLSTTGGVFTIKRGLHLCAVGLPSGPVCATLVQEGAIYIYKLGKHSFPLSRTELIHCKPGAIRLPPDLCREVGLYVGAAVSVIPHENGFLVGHVSRWEEVEAWAEENRLQWQADLKACDWRATLGMGFRHLVR